MKVVINGKGGSGKTSIATHLARIYADEGCEVLMVDTDPNLNLSEFFGYVGVPPLSRMKGVVNDRSRLSNGFVRMKPYVKDITDRYRRRVSGNLSLLVSGAVEKVGSDCLCPENAFLRSLLQDIILKRGEAVIMDMGVNLGVMNSNTLKGVDAVLVITEPSYGSVSVTRGLLCYSNQVGIKNVCVIANKTRGHDDFQYISKKFDIFHTIPYSEEIQKSSMSRVPYLCNGKFRKSIKKLYEKLQET